MPNKGQMVIGKTQTSYDVTRAARRVANWLLASKIDAREASALSGLLKLIHRTIVEGQLEDRIERLEEEFKNIRQG